MSFSAEAHARLLADYDSLERNMRSARPIEEGRVDALHNPAAVPSQKRYLDEMLRQCTVDMSVT